MSVPCDEVGAGTRAVVGAPSVCFVAICKDESELIERCLGCVWPFVTEWVIVDTGSTDDTKEKIAKWTGAKAGEAGVAKRGLLVERPWVNFGHNRTEALQAAREWTTCDWLLMTDIDDIVFGDAEKLGAFIASQPPTVSGLLVRICGGANHVRPHLFRTSAPWKYTGVLHEYAVEEGGLVPSHSLPAVPKESMWLDARSEGVRSRQPFKYSEDALLLERELVRDPTNRRNVFYCAQSWKDAGLGAKAIPHYRQVMEDDGAWVEERYISCLNLVRLLPKLNDECVNVGWTALRLQPQRREVTTALLRRARIEGLWRCDLLGMGMLNQRTGARSIKDAFLFAESGAYTWSFNDELSIMAFYLGFKDLCKEAALEAAITCPPSEFVRIRKNAVFGGMPERLAEYHRTTWGTHLAEIGQLWGGKTKLRKHGRSGADFEPAAVSVPQGPFAKTETWAALRASLEAAGLVVAPLSKDGRGAKLVSTVLGEGEHRNEEIGVCIVPPGTDVMDFNIAVSNTLTVSRFVWCFTMDTYEVLRVRHGASNVYCFLLE